MHLPVERLLARPSQRRAELNRRITVNGERIASVSEGSGGSGLIDEPAAIEPGRLADILVLDHAALARDVIAETLDDLPLVMSRATSRHIKALYVAGREVLADGRLRGVDLQALESEMIATLRKGMAGFNDWQRTVLRMRAGLTRFYTTGMHCS